jgi:hypothetical protein
MKAEPPLLSRMYHAIMLGFVRDGRAPHYTDLAHQLDLGIEDARRTLHELIEIGLPTWLAPNTDYIASFAPFSSIPTQYCLAPDYLLRVTELSRDLPGALERLGQSSPFWRMSPPQ